MQTLFEGGKVFDGEALRPAGTAVLVEGDAGTAQMKLSDAQLALKTLERAQVTLKGGTVAVRDCGGRNYVELSVRDAIRRGTGSGGRDRPLPKRAYGSLWRPMGACGGERPAPRIS